MSGFPLKGIRMSRLQRFRCTPSRVCLRPCLASPDGRLAVAGCMLAVFVSLKHGSRGSEFRLGEPGCQGVSTAVYPTTTTTTTTKGASILAGFPERLTDHERCVTVVIQEVREVVWASVGSRASPESGASEMGVCRQQG